MAKTAVLAVKIIGDAIGAKTAFADAETGAGGLMSKLGKVGPAALAVGGAIVTGAGVAGKALYDIGATWDDVSDGLRVQTGLSGAALDEAFQSAKNVASTIPATIEDVGATTASVIQRMGLSGKTLETVSSQYLEAGRILGDTVDIDKTSAAFAAFGIKGDAVVGGMDDLFRVSQSTGVGMNDLAAIVTKAGPGLTNLGFSFADSAALAGTLDKAGIDAAATMTAMQKGMVTLARAGEEPQAAFKRVVGEIDGFIQSGNTAGAINVASKIFGTKGAAQFVAAVQSGTVGVEDLMGAAGTTTDTILGLGKETGDAAEKWQILQNKAMVALEPIASAIFTGAGAALDWLMTLIETTDWTPFQTALDSAATGIGGFVAAIQNVDWSIFQDGVGTITGVLGSLWPLLEQIVGLVQQFMPVVKAVFDGIMGILGPALDLITNIIKTVLAVIKGDWSGAWNGLKGIASSVVNLIKGIVNNWIGQMKAVIQSLNLQQLFTRAWDGAKTAFTTGVRTVVQFFRDLPGQIVSAISGINGRLSNVGTDMMRGLIGGVKAMARRVVDSVYGVIDDAISGAKRLLGIASPSKLFTLIGTQTGQGLVNGILGQAGAVADAATRMVNAAIPTTAPEIPVNLAYTATRNSSAGGEAGGQLNFNFYGDVLDADALVDKLRGAFNRNARARGVVNLAGTVIA